MRLFSVLAVPAVTLFMAAPLVAQEAAPVAVDDAAEQAEGAAEIAAEKMEEAADHAEEAADHAEGAAEHAAAAHAEAAEHAEHAADDHGAPDWDVMYSSYMEAFNSGDTEGVLSHYAEEATAMYQGGPAVSGHAELTARFETLFPTGAQLAIHPGEQHVMGHMAVDQGHYVVTAEVEGETVTKSGYWMAIRHRHDDGWKIVRLISNSDQEM